MNDYENPLIDMTYKNRNSRSKRKVLFIVATCLRDEGNAGNIQDFPYGVLSIIKYNEGFADFEILDLLVNPKSLGKCLEDLISKLQNFSPDIIGISVMFDNAYFSIWPIAETIKAWNLKSFIIIGGPAVSPIARMVITNQPNVDAVCYSEGEIPVNDLIRASNLSLLVSKHPSWISRNDIDTDKAPDKTLVNDINQVIDVSYVYVNVNNYERRVSFNPLDDRFLDKLVLFRLLHQEDAHSSAHFVGTLEKMIGLCVMQM